MAEFLTTQGILHELENIIMNAKSRVVLISPYIKLPQTLFERLKDTDNRNVKITLVYGKDELKPAERSKLEQLNNLSLYFRENLHAKCFFNEEHLVIASMNMYEYSVNNREMGVLIRAQDNEKVYNEAVKETDSILASATKDDSKTTSRTRTPSRTRTTRRTSKPGFCIRCKTSIPYDLDRPYCRKCFLAWSEWENPNYEESYCHTCGGLSTTMIERPQCDSCYHAPQGRR